MRRAFARAMASGSAGPSLSAAALAATSVPDVLEVSATSADGEVMAVRHRELRIDGVQFHPESVLTPVGPEIAKNFLGAS